MSSFDLRVSMVTCDCASICSCWRKTAHTVLGQREPTYDGQYDAHASLNGRPDVLPTSMLCVPWFDPGGDMIALIQVAFPSDHRAAFAAHVLIRMQVVNKRNGLPFTPQDEVCHPVYNSRDFRL
eukprot:2531621-Rhodomonas_salina.6